MNPARIIAPSVLAALLASCASNQPSTYDTTANPYGVPDAASANPPATAAANPIYDSPAAYEDSAAPTAPAVTPMPAPAPAPAPANGAAIIHTVVKGDTLSGISARYKVPAASIKQANRMTNDTVVLGRKMVIPPQ
jgi:LysM repeat protein